MPIPLGSQGQPDFTQPIELMMDCHRRIEHFLEVLGRVSDRLEVGPLETEGKAALETALNYFQQAAPRHTADEEVSLFPRMRQSGDPAAGTALASLERLEADHREAEAAHARLDELGRQCLVAGRLDATHLVEFRQLLSKLTEKYAEHIRLEDELVFAAASETLTAQQLADVGAEMKQRRQENTGRQGSRCAQRRETIRTNGA